MNRKKKKNQVTNVLNEYKSLLDPSQHGVLNHPISLRISTDVRRLAFQKPLHTKNLAKSGKRMKLPKSLQKLVQVELMFQKKHGMMKEKDDEHLELTHQKENGEKIMVNHLHQIQEKRI